MGDFSTLKTAIQAVIKQNGDGEITGNILQSSLISMVNAFAPMANIKGEAVPATTPSVPVGIDVYFAKTAGTYTGFGGMVLIVGEFSVFMNNASNQWSKVFSVNLPTVSQELGDSTVATMSQAAITDEIEALNASIEGGCVLLNRQAAYTEEYTEYVAKDDDGRLLTKGFPVVQSAGQSTANVMSQKAVTDLSLSNYEDLEAMMVVKGLQKAKTTETQQVAIDANGVLWCQDVSGFAKKKIIYFTGDGTNQATITHNLGTDDVICQVSESGSESIQCIFDFYNNSIYIRTSTGVFSSGITYKAVIIS